MNNNRETLQSWVAEQLQAVEEQGSLSGLGCRHHTGAGDDREVYSMKVGHPKWGDVDAMTDLFWSNASRTARGLVGFQQFSMEAIFGQAVKPTRFLPFGISGANQLGIASGGAAFGGMATEGPSAMGQTQQGMRLLELAFQGSFADREKVSHAALALIERLMRDNQECKRENGELWLALREQFAKQIADARAHQMELLKFMRQTEMQRKLMTLAPALVNMLANKDIFPTSTADTSLIMALVEFMPEQDIDRLLTIAATKPEAAQFAHLLKSRLDEIRQQKALEREEINEQIKRATGKTYEDAERDAGGDAARVLTQIGRPPEAPSDGPKILEAAVEVREGVVVEAAVAPEAAAEDSQLIDDLFAKIPPGQVDMLMGLIASDDTELAKRVKARLAKLH